MRLSLLVFVWLFASSARGMPDDICDVHLQGPIDHWSQKYNELRNQGLQSWLTPWDQAFDFSSQRQAALRVEQLFDGYSQLRSRIEEQSPATPDEVMRVGRRVEAYLAQEPSTDPTLQASDRFLRSDLVRIMLQLTHLLPRLARDDQDEVERNDEDSGASRPPVLQTGRTNELHTRNMRLNSKNGKDATILWRTDAPLLSPYIAQDTLEAYARGTFHADPSLRPQIKGSVQLESEPAYKVQLMGATTARAQRLNHFWPKVNLEKPPLFEDQLLENVEVRDHDGVLEYLVYRQRAPVRFAFESDAQIRTLSSPTGQNKDDWPAFILEAIQDTQKQVTSSIEQVDRLRQFFIQSGKFTYYGTLKDSKKQDELDEKLKEFLRLYPQPQAFAHLGYFNCNGAANIFASLVRDFYRLPARVVIGWVAEPASDPQYRWQITSRTHPHAWVEVWSGREWVVFDVTPPDEGKDASESIEIARLEANQLAQLVQIGQHIARLKTEVAARNLSAAWSLQQQISSALDQLELPSELSVAKARLTQDFEDVARNILNLRDDKSGPMAVAKDILKQLPGHLALRWLKARYKVNHVSDREFLVRFGQDLLSPDEEMSLFIKMTQVFEHAALIVHGAPSLVPSHDIDENTQAGTSRAQQQLFIARRLSDWHRFVLQPEQGQPIWAAFLQGRQFMYASPQMDQGAQILGRAVRKRSRVYYDISGSMSLGRDFTQAAFLLAILELGSASVDPLSLNLLHQVDLIPFGASVYEEESILTLTKQLRSEGLIEESDDGVAYFEALEREGRYQRLLRMDSLDEGDQLFAKILRQYPKGIEGDTVTGQALKDFLIKVRDAKMSSDRRDRNAQRLRWASGAFLGDGGDPRLNTEELNQLRARIPGGLQLAVNFFMFDTPNPVLESFASGQQGLLRTEQNYRLFQTGSTAPLAEDPNSFHFDVSVDLSPILAKILNLQSNYQSLRRKVAPQ